jgi:hypothetical protein
LEQANHASRGNDRGEGNGTEEHAPVKAGPVNDLFPGNQIFIDVTHRPSLRANMTAEITALFCREGQ